MLKKSFFNQWLGSNFSSHSGISILISFTGNSLSTHLNISSIFSSFILYTSIICTVTLYFSSISFFNALVSCEFGLEVLSIITNGLFIILSSFITLSSGSKYSSLLIPVILPSVVITRPIVEWS